MPEIGHEPEQAPVEYAEPYWFIEVWQELRPLAIRLFADFAIFTAIWILLLAAQVLTDWFPLETRLSGLVIASHEAIVVTTFIWLSLTAAWEIMWLNRKGARHGTQSQRPRS